MENRDKTSENIGNENDDSTSEFGQNIGRSENLDEPNTRKRGNMDESGVSDRSRSNLGENIPRSTETEH